MGRRHVGRRRHSLDKPWLTRDHAGAPGWAIIATGAVVAGIAAVAALGAGPPEPSTPVPTVAVLDEAATQP